MPKGTITRLIADQGYGFIRTEEEGDIFFHFHRNELVGIAYESLRESQQVEFEVKRTPQGLAAVNVRLTGQVASRLFKRC